MNKISIIVPCYNEEEALPIYYKTMEKIMEQMNPHQVEFELIFVDDGSVDSTLQCMKSLGETDSRVKYVSFSRNFGKEAAIFAGLEYSTGDFVGLMDVDLQDPPEMIEEMFLTMTKEGYDCVGTRRVSRKGEPPIRSFCARLFYRFINKISKTEVVDGARDYRLMTRQMVDSILSLKEYNRFSKGIFGWVGFRTKYLEYENVERVAGETKWSFFKLLLYSFDGIIAFSTAPLWMASLVGFICCLLSVIFGASIVIKTLLYGEDVAGYPSLICMISFLGGIQLLSIGILGQYLAKTYLESKKRPIYITKTTNC